MLHPCANCQKPTRNPKFCSRSCSAQKNNHLHPKRSPEHRCNTCKKPIGRGRKYCKQCRNRFDYGSITIGDIQSKAKYQISALIRTIARNIYRKSNMPKQCMVCGYNKHYEVCHKHSIKSFSNDTLLSVVNDSTNLIALCPNHHWELDNGLLSI